MENFKIDHRGKTYWVSRSCCTGCFIFAKNYATDEWFVLANKRGVGCPNEIGKWNCVGGYVDYDETTKSAAVREVKEETGLTIFDEDLKYAGIFSDPLGEVQNITVKYYATLEGHVDIYNKQISSAYSEKDEVSEVRFIPVSEINNYEWAFNHRNLILDIFNRRVNIPWYKKLTLWLYDKMNLNYE